MSRILIYIDIHYVKTYKFGISIVIDALNDYDIYQIIQYVSHVGKQQNFPMYYGALSHFKQYRSLSELLIPYINVAIRIMYLRQRTFVGGGYDAKIKRGIKPKVQEKRSTLNASFSMSLKNFSTYHTSKCQESCNWASKNIVAPLFCNFIISFLPWMLILHIAENSLEIQP